MRINKYDVFQQCGGGITEWLIIRALNGLYPVPEFPPSPYFRSPRRRRHRLQNILLIVRTRLIKHQENALLIAFEKLNDLLCILTLRSLQANGNRVTRRDSPSLHLIRADCTLYIMKLWHEYSTPVVQLDITYVYIYIYICITTAWAFSYSSAQKLTKSLKNTYIYIFMYVSTLRVSWWTRAVRRN
jgi:hypothetical protein